MTGHQRHRGRASAIALLVAVVLGVGGFVAYRAATAHPKRFAVVSPGRLYRSGEVSPEQLAQLQSEFGVQRVICLLNPAEPETRAEQQAAAKLGVQWLNIGLPGNGASTPAQRDELRRLILLEDAAPTLVHCSAGTNRTGLAVGMFRLYHDGWSLAQVMEEMKRFDFEDEPHHENLRQALAAEAELARALRKPAKDGSGDTFAGKPANQP